MNLAHPTDRPDDINHSYPISIRFASPSNIQFIIKTTMTTALMENVKSSTSISPINVGTDAASPGAKPAPSLQTPFADLMLKPEKLEAVLNNTGGDAAKTKKTDAKSRKTRQASHHSQPKLKDTEFRFNAPGASSVKLAADFTGWEKSLLDLTKKSNGVWSVTVPLAPGRHHYRFIVDGVWCDDPQCAELIPNPFGSANSVKQIGL